MESTFDAVRSNEYEPRRLHIFHVRVFPKILCAICMTYFAYSEWPTWRELIFASCGASEEAGSSRSFRICFVQGPYRGWKEKLQVSLLGPVERLVVHRCLITRL